MLEVSNIRVYDLKESIIACRNSMRINQPEYTDEEFSRSLERAEKLAPLGNGHNNFLSGIRVSFDLRYPNYISPELQRYHFFDIVNSASKMHKLSIMAGDVRSYNKYVTDESIVQMKRLADIYNAEPSYDNFIRLVSNCPMGLELFMRCSTNYLQLRTMYHQRKGHRLIEDWGAFCKFIEDLPHSTKLILK